MPICIYWKTYIGPDNRTLKPKIVNIFLFTIVFPELK